MKTKLFLLIVLFLGISAFTYAQTQTAAPVEKKDAPTVVTTPDQAKTGECTGHQTMGDAKDCKWVDANGDGKCDTCGKTEKECKETCKAGEKKSGDAAGCPMKKECGNTSSCCGSKGGKK